MAFDRNSHSKCVESEMCSGSVNWLRCSTMINSRFFMVETFTSGKNLKMVNIFHPWIRQRRHWVCFGLNYDVWIQNWIRRISFLFYVLRVKQKLVFFLVLRVAGFGCFTWDHPFKGFCEGFWFSHLFLNMVLWIALSKDLTFLAKMYSHLGSVVGSNFGFLLEFVLLREM